MREELKNYKGNRAMFTGTFIRTGVRRSRTRKGKSRETVLLRDVKDQNGKLVCDHIWFNHTDGFRKLGSLKRGDKIKFEAQSTIYIKGYQGRRFEVYDHPLKMGYQLTRLSKLELIQEDDTTASESISFNTTTKI